MCSSPSQRAVDLQAGEVAAQAFRRSAELGLSPGTIQVQGFVYGPVAAWTGIRTHTTQAFSPIQNQQLSQTVCTTARVVLWRQTVVCACCRCRWLPNSWALKGNLKNCSSCSRLHGCACVCSLRQTLRSA